MNYSRMDCLRGCFATLSVLVVRIALLEYSKIHEKAYKCIVCEFGGFQNVLCDACVRAIPVTSQQRCQFRGADLFYQEIQNQGQLGEYLTDESMTVVE